MLTPTVSLCAAAAVSMISTLVMRYFNAPARSLRQEWELVFTGEPVLSKLVDAIAAPIQRAAAIADDLLLRALNRMNPAPTASPFATL